MPSYYSIYVGSYPTIPTRNRLTGLMVGYGVTGTVVDQYNYTFGSSGKGTERWGYNKIDGQLNYVGGIGRTNSGFRMYFDTADTVLEAGAGTGDSGGGVFVNSGGSWKLAGIMTDVSTAGSQDAIYAVDAQDYGSWISQAVPEPTTGIMIFGVAVVFGIIKRIRYMYQ
ncbi:MAG: PEP-CTERM sorting domain-containing protein, partial [Verrucomicrobia bacterium]|nr:PEP-CTERM sorting domain-containing protein [Verrucomicrobiota bacterium]